MNKRYYYAKISIAVIETLLLRSWSNVLHCQAQVMKLVTLQQNSITAYNSVSQHNSCGLKCQCKREWITVLKNAKDYDCSKKPLKQSM